MNIFCSGRDGGCDDDEGEADQRQEREAAEAETLRGGRTRWMLKMRGGITKQRHQREG